LAKPRGSANAIAFGGLFASAARRDVHCRLQLASGGNSRRHPITSKSIRELPGFAVLTIDDGSGDVGAKGKVVFNQRPSEKIGSIPMTHAGGNLEKVMKEVPLADGWATVPTQWMW
jgi:hypothetical protein